MATEAQKRASAKYDKEFTKQVIMKLNVLTDKDILGYLDRLGRKKESKQGFIKAAIRASLPLTETATIWISAEALPICPDEDQIRDHANKDEVVEFNGLRLVYDEAYHAICVRTEAGQHVDRYTFDWKAYKWDYDFSEEEEIGIEEELD